MKEIGGELTNTFNNFINDYLNKKKKEFESELDM